MVDAPKTMRLVLRTPVKTVVDEAVTSITAEDITGRFGLRPGCEPLLAALVPGLLSYHRTDHSEVFVAIGKGLLSAQQTVASIAVREAIPCGSLDELEDAIERAGRVRYQEESSLKGIFRSVYRHLLVALADEERSS